MEGKLDILNLNKQEVDLIIKELKQMLTTLDMNILNTPFGRIKKDLQIVSNINNINFKLSIYRGNIEPERFSLNLRFNDTNECLVRLDIRGGKHLNPDGSIAPESHLHIYNKDYNPRCSYAYPINLDDFPNTKNLYYTTESFLAYTNIK